MPDLYFTPAAVGYLAQLILAASISVYLVALFQRRKLWNPQTALLAAFFESVTVFIGLLFLDAAFLPAPRLYAVYLENTVLAAALVLLLQFGYRFPNLLPPRKLTLLKVESYLALGLSAMYAAQEAQIAFYRYVELLERNTVHFRPPGIDMRLIYVLLWVQVVFFRQSVLADTRPADARPVSWLCKLWNPQGAEARAAREFTLIYLAVAGLGYVNILRTTSAIPTSFYNISLSIGILLAMWLFASRYINVIHGGASVLAKLSAITLTLFLAVFGAVGWLVALSHADVYRPAIADHQTLRFTPNASGGYDVAAVDFAFETDLGRKLPEEAIEKPGFSSRTASGQSVRPDENFEPQRKVEFPLSYRENPGSTAPGEPRPGHRLCPSPGKKAWRRVMSFL